MKKPALEQVSELHEEAKREYYAIMGRDVAPAEAARKLEAMRCWAHALAILQSERGNFVG